MNIRMNLVQQGSFSVILLNYIFFHRGFASPDKIERNEY